MTAPSEIRTCNPWVNVRIKCYSAFIQLNAILIGSNKNFKLMHLIVRTHFKMNWDGIYLIKPLKVINRCEF